MRSSNRSVASSPIVLPTGQPADLDSGLVPVYATTRRESVEERLPDGDGRTVRRFKHVRFRRYGA